MKNHYVRELDGTVTIFAKRHGELFPFVIDGADFERVDEFPNTWVIYSDRKARTYYVVGKLTIGKSRRRTVSLHRWVTRLDWHDKREVDHIDGDGRNNRRSNLSVCTRTEHARAQALRSRRTVPEGDPNGLTAVKFSVRRLKNIDGGYDVFWMPSYVHGVYLGDKADYSDSLIDHWLALNIVEGATDEQIQAHTTRLGHDPDVISAALKRLRTLFRRPNPTSTVEH